MADLSITLPLHTVSESNARGHWAKRARRAKDQRETTLMVLANAKRRIELPCVVTITRVAPRALDDDNLRGATKAVRDGVADFLGVNDRNPLVVWKYAQERGAPKTCAVRVEIQEVRS